MKGTRKFGIAVAGTLIIAFAVGGAALASDHARNGFVQRRVSRHIDAALDAVGASATQRDAIHAARDHVFATIAGNRSANQGDLDSALALWQANRMDPTAIATLRAHHQALEQKTEAAVVQALSDAHDALTAAQRSKLVDYLNAHRPPQLDSAKPFVKHILSERLDDVLDQIHATADQRSKITATIDGAFATVTTGMSDHAAHFDEAIAVFTADTIDASKIASLQAARQAKMQKLGDALVQALTDIHDTLDAGQRKTVADYIKSHHHGG